MAMKLQDQSKLLMFVALGNELEAEVSLTRLKLTNYLLTNLDVNLDKEVENASKINKKMDEIRQDFEDQATVVADEARRNAPANFKQMDYRKIYVDKALE